MRCLFWIPLLMLTAQPLFAQLPPPVEPPPGEQPKEVPEETKEALDVIEKAIEKGDLAEEVYKIAVAGEVNLNYVFAESPDSFVVTYKFRMEGRARNKVDLIKEKGQILTGIEGFLAKWPTGECLLNIAVGEFPFEMVFNKVVEDQVRLDIKIIADILENWESNCTFLDAPGSKFHTSGNPEKWVMRGLQRPMPSLTDLTLPIDRLHKETSTMEFKIEPLLIPDPPLGSAEIEGKGTIKIIPERL